MNLRESRYNRLYDLLNAKDIYIVPNQEFRNISVFGKKVLQLNNNICPYSISKDLTTEFSGGVLAKSIDNFGTESIEVLRDEYGNICNIADVYNFETKEPLVLNGKQVKALIQTSKDTMDGSPVENNLQVTFIIMRSGEPKMVDVTARIYLNYPILNSLRNRPETYFYGSNNSSNNTLVDNFTLEEVDGVIRIKNSDKAVEGSIYQYKNGEFTFNPVVDGGTFG